MYQWNFNLFNQIQIKLHHIHYSISFHKSKKAFKRHNRFHMVWHQGLDQLRASNDRVRKKYYLWGKKKLQGWTKTKQRYICIEYTLLEQWHKQINLDLHSFDLTYNNKKIHAQLLSTKFWIPKPKDTVSSLWNMFFISVWENFKIFCILPLLHSLYITPVRH